MKKNLIKGFLKLILILFVIFSFNNLIIKNNDSVTGENDFALGLIPTKEASLYNQFDFSKISIKSLPASVDLSNGLPPVGNQGSQGSCASWSSVYYYKSFQEGKERGWDLGTTNHQFSPAYTYNQIVNGNCSNGSSFPQNFEILKTQGSDTLDIFPYNQYNCSTQPNSSQIEAAYPYRIISYEYLFINGNVIIDNLKSYLASGDIFVVAIPVYYNFYNIPNDPNYVYNSPSGSYQGGHGITVVGYNDNLQAFKVVNSWGTNWGYGGFANLSYNFIQNYAWEAWRMEDYIEQQTPRVWVVQPDGGETLAAGSSYEIRWGYEGISSGYLKIELYKGGVLNRTIVSSATITTGKYNWNIPTTQVSGSDYKIKITYTSNTSVFDESDDFFTIKPPNAKWTILIYLDGDNELEYAAINDMNEMESVNLPNSINVIVQVDRNSGYDTSNGNWSTTRRYKIKYDTNTSIINSQLISDLGELNMGDPQTLIDFTTWGIQNYPADNYVLIIWDHGTGWKSLGKEEPVKGISYDYSNNDYLTTFELRSALNQIKNNIGKKLDIIGFDACLMGMIEIGYEIKDSVDIMVASEEIIPGDGFPYNDILNALTQNSSIDKFNFSSIIVNKYVQSYSGGSQGYADVTLSAINLNNITTISTKVSEFANLLIQNFSTYKNQIYNAWYYVLYFSDSDYIDIYDFARLIKNNISNSSIQNKAQEIMNSFSSVIIAEGHTSFFSNAHGLSIYYPYPINYLNSYGNLLFAQDTYWDDLIKLSF